MQLRCYLFSSCLGELYRWYEELPGERMRVVLVLGEYTEGRWRMRAPDVAGVLSQGVFDKRGDVERVC